MPAGTLYQEDPADEFVYEDDFHILIDSASEPGGGVAFSNGSQDGTIVALIPWNKQRSAVRSLLGFSYCDSAAPWKLHREPPAMHPVWPQMRAASLSMCGYGIKSNPDNPPTVVPGSGEPGAPGGEDVFLPGGQPFIETPWVDPGGTPLYAAYYEWAMVTVKYRSFGMMRFLPDTDIDNYLDEWKRYVSFTALPAVESLSVDGLAQLKWIETSPAPIAWAPGPTLGAAFPAPLAALLAKTNLKLKWLNVPHDYVSSDPVVFNPTRIISHLGAWNADAFLGYNIGELLLLAVEAEPVLFPVVTNDPQDFPVTGWDLTFHFSHFSPPKGVPTSAVYGHRLFIHRDNGKFYFAARDNGYDLLPGRNMWSLFAHVGDTTVPPEPSTP